MPAGMTLEYWRQCQAAALSLVLMMSFLTTFVTVMSDTITADRITVLT